MPAHHSSWSTPLSGLLFPVVSVLVAACGGGEPLAPIEPGAAAAPAAEVASAPGGDRAALTSQRIAFLSRRYNSHPNVFTMDPSGTNVVRLSSWIDDARWPVWSYDNKRLAVVRGRYDPDGNAWHDDIFLMNADGSNKHWIRGAPSTFPIWDPSWSPDGIHLVVSVAQPGGPYLAQLNVTTGDLVYVSPQAGGRSAAGPPTIRPARRSSMWARTAGASSGSTWTGPVVPRCSRARRCSTAPRGTRRTGSVWHFPRR